jgi:streptomycin 3"-adenylyltransferase
MGSLLADLEPDTRNVLLTLARIWSSLETGAIRSKASAAEWVMGRLPAEFQMVMQRARAIYMGEESENWIGIEAKIKPCAQYMTARIKEQTVLLLSTSTNQRSIYLGV